MTNVFTPIDFNTNQRVKFNRSDVEVLEGSLDYRGVGLHAKVRIKGNDYKVYGRSCSIPNCQCDTVLKSVK